MEQSKSLETIKKTQLRQDSIKDIRKMAFIAKKTEKLATAIYRVTDFISNDDPLRARMRGKALDLLEGVLRIFHEHLPSSYDAQRRIFHDFALMDTLLEISHNGSLVSETNFSILADEYRTLLSMVAEECAEGEEGGDVSVSETETDRFSDTHRHAVKKDIFKNSIKDKHELSFINERARIGEAGGSLSPSTQTRDTTGGKAGDTGGVKRVASRGYAGRGRTRESASRSERRALILDCIRKKGGDVGIKDILEVPEIAGKLSEKTLQRELMGLLEEGKIRKRGERRWSRYFLAHGQ